MSSRRRMPQKVGINPTAVYGSIMTVSPNARAACHAPDRWESSLVAALEQPATDDLRLDLGGTLEDVEDACIAQHATDGIFHLIAVASVDLQRVVGIAP